MQSEVPSTSKIPASGYIQVQQIQKLLFKYPVDEKIQEEIIWSLYVSVENNSFRPCDSIRGTFKAMFPDSAVANKFSLPRTKVSYMLSDGIGPVFHQQISDDVKKSSARFTVLYDEATTTGGKKQYGTFELRIRSEFYCSNDVIVGHISLPHYREIVKSMYILCLR